MTTNTLALSPENYSTLFARIAITPPKPGTEAIRAKLQRAKAQLE